MNISDENVELIVDISKLSVTPKEILSIKTSTVYPYGKNEETRFSIILL